MNSVYHRVIIVIITLVPLDLDVKMKAVMVGACFLIVSHIIRIISTRSVQFSMQLASRHVIFSFKPNS